MIYWVINSWNPITWQMGSDIGKRPSVCLTVRYSWQRSVKYIEFDDEMDTVSHGPGWFLAALSLPQTAWAVTPGTLSKLAKSGTSGEHSNPHDTNMLSTSHEKGETSFTSPRANLFIICRKGHVNGTMTKEVGETRIHRRRRKKQTWKDDGGDSGKGGGR